jgi:hypothetical protein
MSKNPYTEAEDRVIMELMIEHPDCPHQAFYEASVKLNRPLSSISSRYYNHLDNPESKHYQGSVFMGVAKRLYNIDKRIIKQQTI